MLPHSSCLLACNTHVCLPLRTPTHKLPGGLQCALGHMPLLVPAQARLDAMIEEARVARSEALAARSSRVRQATQAATLALNEGGPNQKVESKVDGKVGRKVGSKVDGKVGRKVESKGRSKRQSTSVLNGAGAPRTSTVCLKEGWLPLDEH